MIQIILAIYIITTVGIDSQDVGQSRLLCHYNMYYGLVYYLIKIKMVEDIGSV